MHIPLSVWLTACLSISGIPRASAFYSYTYGAVSTPKAPRDQRTYTPRRLSNAEGSKARRGMTLPLRRVPVQRDNKYKIVKSDNPTQKNSIAIDQDGTDLSYMVAVTIGTSQEEYRLLLDSAASNTWVMGSSCTSDACKQHNTFGDGDSTTLKQEQSTFSITYGTGSVEGNTATDTMHFGSLSASVSFGLATKVSSEFASYPMDGILGLGRGDNDPGTIEAPRIMDVLATSKLIDAKLYGVHFSRTKDGVNDGELNLGAPNTDRYDGDLNFIKAVDNGDGFWKLPISDAGVDGTLVGLKSSSAILDSGTSFILMPPDDAVAIHKQIPGYKQSGETFTVPCDTKKLVQIKFGNRVYNISTADYIGGTWDDGNCKSNIIGRAPFGDSQWLVGDVFLKNVYTVFDFDNSQVGFGVKGDGVQQRASASSGAITPIPSATGAPATGTQNSAAQGSVSPTAQAQGATKATHTPSRAAAWASSSASSLALSIALGLLPLFI